MMRKAFLLGGILNAGLTTTVVHAQTNKTADLPTCALDHGELMKAPDGKRLLTQQANLVDQRNLLNRKLADSPPTDSASRKDFEEKLELNRLATGSVQKALTAYSKRESNLAECASALNRWSFVKRIAADDATAKDQNIALSAELAIIAEKREAAGKANTELIDVAPSALAYTRLSLVGVFLNPQLPAADAAQDNLPSATERSITSGNVRCDLMVEKPEANLRIQGCGSRARMRSARSYGGGDVAFPSSVLRPRGLTANLAGSSSDGSVSITYADSFKFRRTPKVLPENEDSRVQLPWEFGYSFGVKAKDGLIFARDDISKALSDNIDGAATVNAGLFFNVYEGETRRVWDARAAKIKDSAIKACRKDQLTGDSKAPSTCMGQSLTDWVFAINPEDGSLLNAALAKQTDDLYFRAKDDKPVWGAGLNFTFARSKYDYLDPTVFVANPATKSESNADWNIGTTIYAFRRLNPVSSKSDISLIGSVSRASNFGYPEGTKPRQFCQALPTGTPYVTGSCPSYYTASPTFVRSWTPAVEVRFLTTQFGPIPSIGFSPKLSYIDIGQSTADRTRIDLPVIAFVDKEAGLGVGFQYSREWGGTLDVLDAGGREDRIDPEDKLTIVVTKTFSLTGL